MAEHFPKSAQIDLQLSKGIPEEYAENYICCKTEELGIYEDSKCIKDQCEYWLYCPATGRGYCVRS